MTLDKKLNVAFAIDKDFIAHFATALTSLLETNRNLIDRVFLLHSLADNKSLNDTINFFQENYCVHIESYVINRYEFDKFYISNHISIASYYRFLLPTILPDNIQSVLYLDSDLVVIDNIQYLTELDFTGNIYAYAVKDSMCARILSLINTRCNSRMEKCFNAGVMLLNLTQMRQDNIAQICCDIALQKHKLLVYLDQDVLNLVFEGRWVEIDRSYNAHHITAKLVVNPKIVHFTGSYKPWHLINNHPYRVYYWFYRNKTLFKTRLPSFKIPVRLFIISHMPKKLKKIVKCLWYNLPLVKRT